MRSDEHGSLEFLGRTDDQVKIRGFRIEPGEVESVLAAHDDVRQATVQVTEPRPGERRLVGYVVAHDGHEDAGLTGTLREHLRDHLPEHMVPAAVVLLDELPVTSSGKIDRAALPEPDLSALVRGLRPGSPREELLCTLFAEVLEVPGIGVDDDFFALGGDSISSIQLARRAREAGLRFTPRQLFEHPTVQELAGVVTARKPRRRTAEPAEDTPAAGTVELDDTARAALENLGEIVRVGPVSALQEGFYFHAALGDDATQVYTVQRVVDIGSADGSPVDGAALRAAFEAVLERHPQLRAGFAQRGDGRIVQAVAARVEPDWSEVDMAGRPAAERAAFLDAERLRPFDLGRPPLVRAAVLHSGPGRAELALTFQHAVLDGWSVALVVREVLQRYVDAADAVPEGGDPAERLTAWFAQLDAVAADRPAALAAWTEELAGIDEPTLLVPALPPGQGPETGARRGEGLHEQCELVLDERRTAALTEQVRAHGITLSTLLHGAWGLVVGGLTGSGDVLVGSTVSGRDAPVAGIDEAVGLFINTLPVRVRFRPGEPLGEPLRRLHASRAALLDHQQIGLGELQRLVRDGAAVEPFDTLVVVENHPQAGDTAVDGGLRVHGEDVRDAVHYPLALLAGPGRELRLTLKYDADRVPAAAAALLVELLERHLDTFARAPRTPVASVALRPGARPDTGPELVVPHATLPSLIADQAARTPDATAVVGQDATLSYAELDRRSAELAGRLRARGAGPGRIVGVAVPRSAELMVALVGVLRSGAAYLPLDLDYPAERLAFMASDAGVDTVVVDSVRPELDGVELVPTADQGSAPDTADPDPDDAAYLIYTSGSTGRPKGVVVSHRAIVNRLVWMQDEYGLVPDDRVLQKTPASFDVSVWEFFWPLCRGAAVVLARPDGHRDPEYLAGLIGRERITTMHFVPSMLEGFLAAGAVTADASWARHLTRVFCSGEALPADAAARWRDLTGVGAAQPLRADRGRRRRHLPPGRPPAVGAGADRTPGREHRRPGARPVPAAGTGRRPGRAVPVRCPAGPRLPRPPGPDRRPLRRRPLRRPGRADVPHRRRRAPGARRRAGVPRPRRRPGEDPGQPDRARRDRHRARDAARCRAFGRGRAPRRGRARTRRLRRAGRLGGRPGGVARHAGRAAPGADGAVRGGAARCAAAESQRQAGPRRAARSGDRPLRARPRAGDRRRAHAVRGVRRRARPRRVRAGRRLPLPRRGQHHVDLGGHPGPRRRPRRRPAGRARRPHPGRHRGTGRRAHRERDPRTGGRPAGRADRRVRPRRAGPGGRGVAARAAAGRAVLPRVDGGQR